MKLKKKVWECLPASLNEKSTLQEVCLYWRNVAFILSHQGEIAVCVNAILEALQFPATTVEVERTFSYQKRFFTSLRRRLGRQRLANLLFVPCNRHFLKDAENGKSKKNEKR